MDDDKYINKTFRSEIVLSGKMHRVRFLGKKERIAQFSNQGSTELSQNQ